MLLSGDEYRESLRRLRPRVFVNGRQVGSVVDEPLLRPGVNAIALTYDFALRPELEPLMKVGNVNRMVAVPRSSDDLLNKLEAVRLVCQHTGCAQRYLTGDGFAALCSATHQMDADMGTRYQARVEAYVRDTWAKDLTVAIAMTDAKGDRTLRPHAQLNPDVYVHITARRHDGIVVRGAKAIVTGAPYVHELLVLPGRAMLEADAEFAVGFAVPIDAPGLTLVARPAGRPGDAAATFSHRYGQSTAVAVFEDVFVPWDRVFLAGEWQHASAFTYAYATHHRHTCIAARAGFGDLLIGAGALMTEANGIDLESSAHLRTAMLDLIRIVEGFFACGVAASAYGQVDDAGVATPDVVFANVGKMLLATQIYDMHRLAHQVSGGLIVTLPGPEEDHNPATGGRLSELLAGRSDIPYEKRIAVARLIEDLTASSQGGWYSVISLHGGGSPEAMNMEIWRHYPLGDKVDLVERLLERGVLADGTRLLTRNRQPGRCCVNGCMVPLPVAPPRKNLDTVIS